MAFRLSVCMVVLAAGSVWGQSDKPTSPTLDPTWVSTLKWRLIGPANMGGRITDLAVNPTDPTNYWVATATGGLLKTVTAGTTFEHQFDKEATVSLGDVTVAPSNPEILWAGTGEDNPRNSVSWGDGVYKSIDGGKTWANMGLKQSYQIGRILIHPTNPDIVYVGAMGRCWGPSEERGLFKSTDGGKAWEKILYIDDKTGVIDMVMHPKEPDTLVVAMWERQRDGFDTNDPIKKWGPGSGLHKTVDGGKTFKRLTSGLPDCELGRVGMDVYLKEPSHIYAVMESERAGMGNANAAYLGLTGENADGGARVTRVTDGGPAAAAGLKTDEIIVSINAARVVTYEGLLTEVRKLSPGDKVKIGVVREEKPTDVELTLGKRPGTGNDRPYGTRLGGQNGNIQDQQGPDGHRTGGVYRSDDFGDTWVRLNSLAPRPMYFSKIRVDPTDENNLYVLGVSFHSSKDNAKTFTEDLGRGVHADHHALWINPANNRHLILGGDGGLYETHDRGTTWDHLNHMALGQFYHVALDTRPVYNVYGGLQDNGSWGGPVRTRAGGAVNSDWFRVGGGDGFVCAVDPNDPDQVYSESQGGATSWRNLRTGRGGSLRPAPEQGLRYRFNWKTPFLLSAHNAGIYYNAGNYVFRTLQAGKTIKRISPEITRTDRGSATALAESPRDADALFVGTDDGALWATRNGGHTWSDLFKPEEMPSSEPTPTGRGQFARGNGGGGGAPGGAGMLARMDSNGDGKLQKDELPERMQAMFEQLDADKNGTLEESEMAAMRGGRGGQGGPGRRAGGQRGGGGGAEEESESGGGGGGGGEEAEAPAAPAPQPEPAAPARTEPAANKPTDPVTGLWNLHPAGELSVGRQEAAPMDIRLALAADGKLTAEFDGGGGGGGGGGGRTISGATFDAATGDVKFEFDGSVGLMKFTGKIVDGKLSGRVEGEGATYSMNLEGTRAQEQPAQAGRGAGRSGRAGGRQRGEEIAPAKPLAEFVPQPRWVSSIEASRFADGRVYVTLDGHRSDDDAPYVLASEDYGRSWRSLASNLPKESTKVIREDVKNQDVLYLGTEFGCYVSINRGKDWTKLNSNLPTVPVHDFAQHPTTGDLVAATHGRSLWVMDATPIRQLTPESVQATAHLYKPNSVMVLRNAPERGAGGARPFRAETIPSVAQIYYSLSAPANEILVEITEPDGTKIREVSGAESKPGLHMVSWDLRRTPAGRGAGGFVGRFGAGQATGGGQGQRTQGGGGGGRRGGAGGEEGGGPPAGGRAGGGAGGGGAAGGGGGGGGGGFGGRGGFGQRTAPGTYKVVLTVDGQKYTQEFTVQADPDFPNFGLAEGEGWVDEMQPAEIDEEEEDGQPMPRIDD